MTLSTRIRRTYTGTNGRPRAAARRICTTIPMPKRTEKIEMKKFDPVVRKHVIYKEAKIK